MTSAAYKAQKLVDERILQIRIYNLIHTEASKKFEFDFLSSTVVSAKLWKKQLRRQRNHKSKKILFSLREFTPVMERYFLYKISPCLCHLWRKKLHIYIVTKYF
jgi:hypothetical protein